MTKYEREIKPSRDAWRDSQPQRCMWCGKPAGGFGLWLEVHEMLSRAHAPKSWGFNANYLLVHNVCHEIAAAAPHYIQLAHKLAYDPDNYDLDKWLRVRNPNALLYVTPGEVAAVRVGEWP